jgi:hypothetical protein
MPVADVKAVLAAPDAAARNALIAAHLNRLEAELAQTRAAVESLRDLLAPPDGPAAIKNRSVPATAAAAITAVVDRADALAWWQGALGELAATIRAQDLPAGGVFASELIQTDRGQATVSIPVQGSVRPIGRVTSAVIPGPSRPRHRADCAGVLPAAQCRAVGGDHTAPDTVLADIPRPQRQFQALGAYKAGDADGDRRGRLVAGLACFRTGREPLVGIEAAVSAAGVPDDLGPQGLIGQRDGRRRIRRPGSGPVRGVGGRPVIRRRGGA